MQALRLGERLRKAGLTRVKVYSSQWCRCLETAQLLGIGQVEELPALNSIYNRPEDRERNVTALRAFLAALPATGPPVVLVTHQFTIAEFTGGGTGSGGGTVFELDGTGTPRVVASIEAN
jgi:broad specificity phosphatase PhoE